MPSSQVTVSSSSCSLDLRRDRRLLLLDYFLRKRSIGQRLDHALPVIEHPGEELLQDFSLVGIGGMRRYQQPREAGDRVSVLARRVGDGDAEIVGHLYALRGRGRALQA